MRITIRGKNVEMTETLEKYADKKIEKLEKYFPIKEATVTESLLRGKHVVEVTLEGDGILLRGEERSDSMYASIDLVVEKLETQIKRFKGRMINKSHPSIPPKELRNEEEIEEAPPVPSIVRTKKVALKPMSAEEAAMQMEMINHTFFIFMNSDTNQVNVIYKRHDGDYGMLEPDV